MELVLLVEVPIFLTLVWSSDSGLQATQAVWAQGPVKKKTGRQAPLGSDAQSSWVALQAVTRNNL